MIFFAMISLISITNADIPVCIKEANILLSWRDDEQCGSGWDLFGG